MKPKPARFDKAFTLVELLVIVAAVGTLSSVAYVATTGGQQAARANKLQSDVATINRAAALYVGSGGSLEGVTHPSDVIAKLKTVADDASSVRTIGLTGSFLDPRVRALMQTPEDAGTSQLRAVWVPEETRFVLASSGGAGVKEFLLDDNEASAAVSATAAETRQRTKDAATESNWVWDAGEPTVATAPPAPAEPVAGALSGGLAAAAGHGLAGGFFDISNADGRVDVVYGFREAGYNSRLALVSLEGMGPENYDLTTDAGRFAFLEELVRRAVDGDRAQVIIDASTARAGQFEQDYYFRPGDTVVAVLIPNASFAQSLAALQNGVRTGTSIPITSLHMGTSEAPFHQGQIAYLGNNGYAIEDIPGGGDADYDDMVFTAHGLSHSEGSSFRTIDPTTYYPQRLAQLGRNYWNNPYKGGPSLQQALINMGIIGGN